MSRKTNKTHQDKRENKRKKDLSSDRPRLNGGVDDGHLNSGLHSKPDPDQEENQSVPSGTQLPCTGELYRLFSFNWPFFPHPTAWSSAMPWPSHSFPRKPISTLSSERPCDASRQTPRRPAVYSLDYICLPVCLSHYLCNVSMEMDGVVVGGGWCIGGYSKSSVRMFCSSPLSCYILLIWSVGQRLKKPITNTLTNQLRRNTKKAMLNIEFFYGSHRVILI